MFLIILAIFFCFFMNYIYIIYNEAFLLGIYLLIFFIIIYISLKYKFKIYNIFKILKKYIAFIFLYRVNLYYNKLLIYLLINLKVLFKKFIIKVKVLKYIIGFIQASLLNKHNSLIYLFYLFFFYNMSDIKKSIIFYFSSIVSKLNFHDSILFN